MTAPVVGIDLGTTNTVVAVVRDGQASALPDEAGEKLIPSVVSFHPNGNVLVGRTGKERRLVDARNTIYSVKRLIGRSWDSEEVRRARARFPFEMREGPGQAALVVARGETYTLPEISAFVLRKAKAVAETALGTTIERAVITVPANFNDLQRAATKVAGRVAGLEVLRILNEPTAAALAYGYGKSTTERLAVYDFGGGTFDVTLLDLSDNVFEVLATAGNTFLGGDDVDVAVAEKMSDEFLAQHRYDPRTDPLAFERLRAAAETLKMKLSLETDARVKVAEVAHGTGGKALDLDFSMTRAEFDRLVGPIVDKTFDVCREALGIARLQAGDFDQVLLVGGSTRIAMVRRRVEEFFKRQVLAHISPDEVVAIGAGIQASALTGAERRRGDVPPAPRPAARDTQDALQPRKRPATVPQGGRAKLDTNPFGPEAGRARFDTNPFGPNTQPFSRERHSTSPGLQGSGGHPAAGGPRPMVVQPPGGLPSDRSAPTSDPQERKRQTTGMGLGGPAPQTAPGVGPRVRVKTGPGLGPGGEATHGVPPRVVVRGPTAEPPARAAQPPARTVVSPPATTLLSAQGAAETARRAVEEIPLPLVGIDDTQAEDVTKPAAAPELTPDQIAEKYGNLPLVMPGAVRPEAPRARMPSASNLRDDYPRPRAPSTPDLSANAPRARMPSVAGQPPHAQRPKSSTLVLGTLPGIKSGVTDESVPAFTVHDEDLEEEITETHGPSPEELRALGASFDDVTRVRRGPSGSFSLEEDESELPIPDVPESLLDEEVTTTGHVAPSFELDEDPRAAPRARRGTPAPAAPILPLVAGAAGALGAAAALRGAPARPAEPWPSPAAPPPPPANFVQTAPMAATPFATPAPPPPFAAPAPWQAAPPPPNAFAPQPAPPPSPITAPFAPVPAHPAPLLHDYQPPGAEPAVQAPLLVDVTPLSLAVETVSGFCDTIISRNTPVPCERRRDFVTAIDNQTAVRVRISQGESTRFNENTLLGELELSGLRPAPRGAVQIAVSFSLDTDGILNVSAKDVATGRATSARVKLIGAPEQAQLEQMMARHVTQPVV